MNSTASNTPINVESKKFRTIGRQLARQLTDAELRAVSGANYLQADPGTHGPEDHSPTGNPCHDCD